MTGTVRQTSELIRFVVGPDESIVPDLVEKLPGRGIWTTACRSVLDRAIAKRLFQRAARRQVRVDPDLPERIERLLAERCLQLLGLARRAGELVTGYEQVAALAGADKAALLLGAYDAAAGGRAKVRAKARRVLVVDLFSSEELSLALGRQNVVHAVLCRGGLAERFRREAVRLAGFRAGDGNDGDASDGGTVAGERVQ